MNTHNFNKQAHSTLQGQIHGLLNSLRQLAPHPTQKNTMAPLFLNSHATFKPVSEHDSMLGTLVMESFLGATFFDAANDMSATPAVYMDFGTISDWASEYMSESAPDQGRGKGTIALGEHKVIANGFNMNSTSPAMMAFLQDLPERRQIEEHIASLVREMDDQEPSAENALTLAAA